MYSLALKITLLSIHFVSAHSLSLQGILTDQNGSALKISWNEFYTIPLRLPPLDLIEADTDNISLHIQCEQWWVCAVNRRSAINVTLSRDEEVKRNISIDSFFGYIDRSELIVKEAYVRNNANISLNLTLPYYEVRKSAQKQR